MLGAVAGMMTAPTRLPRPEHDADDPALRLCRGGARRPRQPVGAVVGGLLLGVLNLLGTYVDFVGADLRLPAALLVILVVLLVRRPASSAPVVRRV